MIKKCEVCGNTFNTYGDFQKRMRYCNVGCRERAQAIKAKERRLLKNKSLEKLVLSAENLDTMKNAKPICHCGEIATLSRFCEKHANFPEKNA